MRFCNLFLMAAIFLISSMSAVVTFAGENDLGEVLVLVKNFENELYSTKKVIDSHRESTILSQQETVPVAKTMPMVYAQADTTRHLDESTRAMARPAGVIDITTAKRIQASVGTSLTYDDNIYRTETGEKEDLITTISPMISSYYGNSDYMVSGFYSADMIIHAKDDDDSRFNQSFGVRGEFFKNGKVKVSISDTMSPTTEAASNETTDFIKRLHNSFNTSLSYDLSPKTEMHIGYTNTLQHYESSSHKDYRYTQHQISPGLKWRLSPKTNITGEYILGVNDYYDSASYDSIDQQLLCGIEGNITPKSTVHLKTGYQRRVYDNSDVRNAHNYVLQSLYSYEFSPKTSFELIVSSGLTESTYADVGYYRSINTHVSCTHSIWENLSLTLSGFYLRSDYPEERPIAGGSTITRERADNSYGASAGLDYTITDWLAAYTQYEFSMRESNINSFEYTNNRVSAGARVTF